MKSEKQEVAVKVEPKLNPLNLEQLIELAPSNIIPVLKVLVTRINELEQLIGPIK
jgi:hypothetical protein